MQIARNSVVLFKYRLSDAAGEILEDGFEGAPVAALQGYGNIIEGLEQALLGKSAGDEFDVVLEPEQAYGLRKDNQIQRVSKKHFADAKRLRPGMQTHLRTEQGTRLVTIKKIGGKVIDVDLNHPLAGQTLHCAIKIEAVREATAQELAHRHAHADGLDH